MVLAPLLIDGPFAAWNTLSVAAAASPQRESVGTLQSPRENPTVADMRKHQASKLNQQRQADLKRDADRLLQLATELKLQVDRSNENMLALDVVKKAEQIEKLARSVREKMKGSY